MSSDDQRRRALNRVDEFSTPIAPKAQKQKKLRLSKLIKAACSALASGRARTQKQAAEIVGCTPEYLSAALSKPHVLDYYQNKVRRELAVGTGPAASRIRHLVWGAESEAVALKASESLLAINGLGPKNNQQVSVSVDIKAGWVIDLSDSGRSSRPPQPGDVIIGGEAVEPPSTPSASDE